MAVILQSRLQSSTQEVTMNRVWERVRRGSGLKALMEAGNVWRQEEPEPQGLRVPPYKMQNRSRNTCPSSTASCIPGRTADASGLGNCNLLASAQLRKPGSQNSECFLQIQHSSHLRIKISVLVECSIWAQTQRYWIFLEGGERGVKHHFILL